MDRPRPAAVAAIMLLMLVGTGCRDYPAPSLPPCLVEGTCPDSDSDQPYPADVLLLGARDMNVDPDTGFGAPDARPESPDQGAVPLSPAEACRAGDDAACAVACNPDDLLSCRIACAGDEPTACATLCRLDGPSGCDVACFSGDEASCQRGCASGQGELCRAACDAGRGDRQACASACRDNPTDIDTCAAGCLGGDIPSCSAHCRAGDAADDATASACALACLDEDIGDPVACGRYIERHCWITLAWSDASPVPVTWEEMNEIPYPLAHVVSDQYFAPGYADTDDQQRTNRWPVEVEADSDEPIPGRSCRADTHFLEPVIEGRARGIDPVPGQGFSMCVATQKDGRFAYIRPRGEASERNHALDNNDLFGIAFACEDRRNGLADLIARSCGVHLTRADNFCGAGLEGQQIWSARPNVDRDGTCQDLGNYMAATTVRQPGVFALLPTPMWRNAGDPDPTAIARPSGDADRDDAQFSRDDSMGVAWRCAAVPERPWLSGRLERSAHVALAWAVGDRTDQPIDAGWPGPEDCITGIENESRTHRCASSSHDGLYHRFNLPFDDLVPQGRPCDVLPNWAQCGDFPADACKWVAYDPDAPDPVCHGRPHDIGIALRGRPALP